MIIGLGNDIIHIPRIEAAVKRFGNAFEARILTPEEQAVAQAIASPKKYISFLAKRFAAKEACVKALGTGFRGGISFQDINVTDLGVGKPGISLTGAALVRLYAITPTGKTATIHLSLSDDYPLAQAVVIIGVE